MCFIVIRIRSRTADVIRFTVQIVKLEMNEQRIKCNHYHRHMYVYTNSNVELYIIFNRI